MKNISLITMSQGNAVALKKTFESFKGMCNEIVYGDLCIFEEDSKLIESYKNEFNLKIIKLPFDFIFKNGFSAVLNHLSAFATNDLCLYMNCSELVDGEERTLALINEKFPNHNCYAIDHATESHIWWRCWNRKELWFSGLIHEEITGFRNECTHFIFMFKDIDKDMDDAFKAKCMNDTKEIVYWQQLIKLVDNPSLIGATNPGWLDFAKDGYESMKQRLIEKGDRYEAFKEGDLEKYLRCVNDSPAFEKERFESNTKIEFQGDPMYLGKK